MFGCQPCAPNHNSLKLAVHVASLPAGQLRWVAGPPGKGQELSRWTLLSWCCPCRSKRTNPSNISARYHSTLDFPLWHQSNLKSGLVGCWLARKPMAGAGSKKWARLQDPNLALANVSSNNVRRVELASPEPHSLVKVPNTKESWSPFNESNKECFHTVIHLSELVGPAKPSSQQLANVSSAAS